jgi:hypothetical protein
MKSFYQLFFAIIALVAMGLSLSTPAQAIAGGPTNVIPPGESGSGGNLTVNNAANSNGNASIAAPNATLNSGFKGSVTGLERGGKATAGSHVGEAPPDDPPSFRTEGTGGKVKLGSQSGVHVKNTATPNPNDAQYTRDHTIYVVKTGSGGAEVVIGSYTPREEGNTFNP